MDWIKIKEHLDNDIHFMDKSNGLEFQLKKTHGSPALLLALDRIVDLDNNLRKQAIKEIVVKLRS